MTEEYFTRLCYAQAPYILKYFVRQNLAAKINREKQESIGNYSITFLGKKSIGEEIDEENLKMFVESWIWDWTEWFASVPSGIPSGAKPRENLVTKMCKFIERYYNWSELGYTNKDNIKKEIFGAVKLYFDDKDDHRYCRRAGYFINKEENGTNISDLEDFISRFKENIVKQKRDIV